MTYKIFIRRKAQKQLSQLPAVDYKKVKQKILDLATNPRPPGSKKLKGRDGWRVRKGNYRIIYEIEDVRLIITVIDVGNRKEIYRYEFQFRFLPLCILPPPPKHKFLPGKYHTFAIPGPY